MATWNGIENACSAMLDITIHPVEWEKARSTYKDQCVLYQGIEPRQWAQQ